MKSLLTKVAVEAPVIEPQENAGTISLSGLVQNIIDLVFMVIGAIALLAIIYGAFLYITAGGDSEKTTKARNVIMYALLGVFVIAAAFILIDWAMTGELFNFLSGQTVTP